MFPDCFLFRVVWARDCASPGTLGRKEPRLSLIFLELSSWKECSRISSEASFFCLSSPLPGGGSVGGGRGCDG